MAEAVVATSRAKLAEVLAGWPDLNQADTWALCFISAAPTAGEISALREAAKLCDRVVCARLTPQKAPPPQLATVVREAGADVLWLPQGPAGRVRVTVEGEKPDETLSLLVEAVQTVLPNLIVVARGALPLIRHLRALQGSWGELFTLRVMAT